MRIMWGLAAAALASSTAAQARMTLESSDLAAGKRMAAAQVFDGFGCTGQNISPNLAWTGAPRSTRSFAVMAFDPDAPTGSGWWHWVVYDVPAATTRLASGASRSTMMPRGAVEARSDFGTNGYGGACPPVGHGVHHYRFTVYALTVDHLPVDAGATAAMIGFQVKAHALASSSIEVTFSR